MDAHYFPSYYQCSTAAAREDRCQCSTAAALPLPRLACPCLPCQLSLAVPYLVDRVPLLVLCGHSLFAF